MFPQHPGVLAAPRRTQAIEVVEPVGSVVRWTRAPGPIALPTSRVSSGRSPNFSVLPFPHLRNGDDNIYPLLQGCCENCIR